MAIVSKENTDTIEVFLGGIVTDCAETEKVMLKKLGQEVKANIVRNLNRHRRTIEREYTNISMADDVKVVSSTDRFGDRVVKVRGGKATGTLWHIVNDGTYRSRPLHFMDGAIQQVDSTIESLWEDGKLK